MLSGRFLGEVSAGDTCQNATAGLNCFGDTAEFVASVASRRHDAGDFESFLRNSTNSLFASCFNTAAAPLRPLRLLVLSGLEAATTVVLEPFVAKSKIPVTVLGMAYNDLHSLVSGPKVAAWSDMPPYSTARGSNFGKQVAQLMAMTSRISAHRLAPAAGDLIYNISRPVLSEAGRLSFYPDTWQELAAVMRQVNATASDPVTGRPRHALCIPVATDSSVVMYAVMASIMQTGDVTQGWLYDPLTLEPLTNNTAMLKVLRIMWELSPFMRSFDSAITIDMGECAIALADSSVFKSLHIMYYNRNLMGQLTMSPLPASTEVLDRSTMQLVPCTAQLCNSQRATMLGGQLVNLAPSRYKAAQLIGLTHQVPQQLHKAVYDFIAFMALLVYKPGDPLAEPGAAAWKGMGYNYADVQSYAHALSSILALPYTAMDFRVADDLKPLSYTQSALLALIGCSNPLVPRSAGSPADFAAAMTSMTAGLRAVRETLGAAAFREQLWGTTGFAPPGLPPPPTPPSPSPPLAGGPALSTPLLATAIAVPVGVCLVVMVLLLVIITHLRRHAKLPRSLMGHVLPPAAGDKATLVITDVQGSSKLWELLPAGVMEASMKLHDELTRRLTVVNLGYEWATEGDSFLLCFHTPEAAVTFATQLQVGSGMRCCSAASGLSSCWPKAALASPCALLRRHGLPAQLDRCATTSSRVMVLLSTEAMKLAGMHTGLAADEVLVQSRMGVSLTTYGGAALVLAKAVQLPVEELRSKGIGVVHAGEHLVALGEGRGSASVDLTLRQLQPGVLHAPVGSAAVAFMSVAGMAQLRAWNTELARECLALYQATAQRVLLHVAGRQLPAGYLVSTADEDGMVLAAFSSSLQCLHWALLTLTTCMDLDWPQALLDSLLGEEVVTRQFGQPAHLQPPLDTPAPMQPATLAHDTVSTDDITVQLGSLPAPPATQGKAAVAAAEVEPDRQSLRVTPSATPDHFSVRLMRGLRLKAGVDAGEVAFEVTPATGRANYKGRCLNRAARINSLALSGQVWCPEPMWTAAASYKPQPAAHSQEQALDAVRLPACSPASWSSQGQRCESTLSILKSGTNRTMTPKMSVSFSHREPSLLGPLAPASCPDPAPAVLDVGSNSLGASQAGQCGPSALWDAAQQQLHTPLSPAAACCVGGNRSSVTLRTRGQPLALPDMLPPLVGQHLGQVELRGIPGQVALIQVSLATHTSRAQLEAADRLGLTVPGLQLSRAQWQPDA
ncbi:hypothetical protein QJQ45_007101 [Haematococcus lacustris]|nr:hypothetical protein QJQ45_007101 [Haematococcus lacustris]